MTRKPALDDLIIVLPGIMGSVLQKDGRDIWAVSRQSLWGAVRTGGKILETLQLDHSNDDPDLDDLGDGIRADRLMANVHLLPGIAKIDGYSLVLNMIESDFDVVRGDRNEPAPANLYEFPYDWRRDNRCAARQLKEFVDDRLAVWRDYLGTDTAEVILIAHSMGGLVCRHYLEVLGGAETARALFTFGTPFRGSPQALESLSEGMKKGWLDLTDMLRSLNSVYQLLPVYPSIHVDGHPEAVTSWRRPSEVADLPGIGQQRAADALAFHRTIEDAVERNGRAPYVTVPYQGFNQRTVESAAFSAGALHSSENTPSWIDANLAGGDGTVPRVSATPIEMSEALRDVFVSDKHSALQNNAAVLDDLHEQLRTLASAGLSDIRGGLESLRADGPGLGLHMGDIFVTDEPIVIEAAVHSAVARKPLTASVENLASTQASNIELAETSGVWSGAAEGLEAGLYRATVAAVHDSGTAAVSDIFEVLP